MSYYRGVDDDEWETEYTSKRREAAEGGGEEGGGEREEGGGREKEEEEHRRERTRSRRASTKRPKFRFMTTDQTQILRLMKKTGIESFYDMEIKEDKGYTSVTAQNEEDLKKIAEYLESKGKLHYIYLKE